MHSYNISVNYQQMEIFDGDDQNSLSKSEDQKVPKSGSHDSEVH